MIPICIPKQEDCFLNQLIMQKIQVVFRVWFCKSSQVNKSSNVFLNDWRNIIFIESWSILGVNWCYWKGAHETCTTGPSWRMGVVKLPGKLLVLGEECSALLYYVPVGCQPASTHRLWCRMTNFFQGIRPTKKLIYNSLFICLEFLDEIVIMTVVSTTKSAYSLRENFEYVQNIYWLKEENNWVCACCILSSQHRILC